jgi:hypothetical protein
MFVIPLLSSELLRSADERAPNQVSGSSRRVLDGLALIGRIVMAPVARGAAGVGS